MRLLVFSDSHGHFDRMAVTADLVKPDAVLHLGDYISDAIKMQTLFPGVAVHAVKGNCDFSQVGEKEQVLRIDGVTIFMAHGHTYNVKTGVTSFKFRAQEICADIALYGHTHRAMLEQVNGIWFMNPGQMERHDRVLPATYGIIAIENGKVDMALHGLQ